MSKITKALQAASTGNLAVEFRNRFTTGQRRLYKHPMVQERWTWSARRINQLHAEVPSLMHYLEIGLSEGTTFENIRVPHRVGVDPAPKFELTALPRGCRVEVSTSDEFFAGDSGCYDLVFIDGLHTYQQTYRDVINSLHACPRGAILVDDVVPTDEVSAIPDLAASMAERKKRGLAGAPWHGDVFRVVPCLVMHHPELEIRTIIDGGNPQLLLWKKSPESVVTAVSAATLAGYADLSYGKVFGEGIPESFQPSSEVDALAEAANRLADRYDN